MIDVERSRWFVQSAIEACEMAQVAVSEATIKEHGLAYALGVAQANTKILRAQMLHTLRLALDALSKEVE